MAKEKITFEGRVLSQEQINILVHAKNGEDILINAGPGSGKTLTLRCIAFIAQQSNLYGYYLCFNSSIAEHSKSLFPQNVLVSTLHGMAYRELGYRYYDRLKRKLTPGVISKEFLTSNCQGMGISKLRLSAMLLKVIESFCYSSKREIDETHLENLAYKNIDSIYLDDFKFELLRQAKKLWLALIDETPKCHNMPISHDIYYKVWSLSHTHSLIINNRSFCLIDEAQDLAEVTIDLLEKCNLTKIFVGDSQQQLYAFRGATSALEKITSIKNKLTLNQSYRFGAEIAELCNRISNHYLQCNPKIIGNKNVNSRVIVERKSTDAKPEVIICRTNFGVISKLFEMIDAGQNLVRVLIDIDGLINDLLDVDKLKSGMKLSETSDFNEYENWDSLIDFANSDEGKHLNTLIRLLRKYPIATLVNVLKIASKITEKTARITIANCHTLKGLEWDHVYLHNDFKLIENTQFSKEEGRLLFVAASRAKLTLDISNCSAAKAVMPESVPLTPPS